MDKIDKIMIGSGMENSEQASIMLYNTICEPAHEIYALTTTVTVSAVRNADRSLIMPILFSVQNHTGK